jgi:glutamine synthetase
MAQLSPELQSLKSTLEAQGIKYALASFDIHGMSNPYLGAAILLAAGLEGIREGLDPGEPHTENMYKHSAVDLKKMGIHCLPRNLESAIESFAADPLSEKVMGSSMYKTYIDFKTQEWEEYHSHVSDWEIQRYLKFF